MRLGSASERLFALMLLFSSQLGGVESSSLLWKRAISPRSMAVSDALVVVVATGRIVAFDSSTGAEKWSTSLENQENRMSEPPVLILGNLVVAAVGRQLFAFDSGTGKQLLQSEFEGGIQRLVGPPLLVQYGLPGGSAVEGVDVRTGKSLARSEFGFIQGLWIESGTVVVHSDRKSVEESPKMSVMSGLDLDLKPKWTIREDFLDFELVDGTPVVSYLSLEDRGATFHPIDLDTGSLGQPLPARGAYESEWGGGTWEFEVPTVGESGESIRRNDRRTGGAKWIAKLPFGGHILVHNGDRIFWFGGDGEVSSLAEIAWATGEVRRVCKGFPSLNRLFAVPGGLVGWAFDGSVVGIADPCDGSSETSRPAP